MPTERHIIKSPEGLTAEEHKQLAALVNWHPAVGALLKVMERQHDVISALVEAHNDGHYHELPEYGDIAAGNLETSEDLRYAPEPAPAPTEAK